MRWKISLTILLFSSQWLSAAPEVRKVDFLAAAGLQVNGAGPLLVRMDTERNRLVLANTLTSSVSLIACENRSVCNIPISSRVPQYLKSEALAIDSRTGNIYVIGNNSSFFIRGQFGDCLYDLCKIKTDAGQRIWISDFLSGKLFIIGPQGESLHLKK